jgi:hypothetical protein
VIIGSSGSSGSIGSQSSESLPESSEASMLTLPTEPGIKPLSDAFEDHCDSIGASTIIELIDNFLGGTMTALCVIVGEESGEDCSARVEWWRFVAARV